MQKRDETTTLLQITYERTVCNPLTSIRASGADIDVCRWIPRSPPSPPTLEGSDLNAGVGGREDPGPAYACESGREEEGEEERKRGKRMLSLTLTHFSSTYIMPYTALHSLTLNWTYIHHIFKLTY
jgi:hypothetical protein